MIEKEVDDLFFIFFFFAGMGAICLISGHLGTVD
jgi:hypothetical protein